MSTTKPLVLILALLAGGMLGWRVQPGQEEEGKKDTATEPVAAAKPAWSKSADIVGVAAHEELVALYTEAAKISDPLERKRSIRLLCARWADLDPERGLKFLTQCREGGEHDPALHRYPEIWLLADWAHLDFESAFGYTSSLGREASLFQRNISEELLATNFNLFWKWFIATGEPTHFNDGEQVLSKLTEMQFNQFLEIVKEAAVARAGAGRVHYSRDDALLIACRLHAMRDPEAGMAWVASLPKRVRNTAARSLLARWAESDPIATGEHLDMLKVTMDANGDLHSSGSESVEKVIFTELAKNNPARALEWAKRVPSLQEHAGEVMADVFSRAIASGEMNCRDIYRALPDLETSEHVAYWKLLRSVANGLPPGEKMVEAMRWVEQTADGKSKAWAREGIIARWFQVDPAGLGTYLAQNPEAGDPREIY